MKALYTLLLLAWIAFGTYFCSKKFCGSAKAKPAATTAAINPDCDVSLKFIDGDFELTTKSNFQFGASKHKFKKMPDEGLVADLQKVKEYLSENPERALQIEGLYLDKELNKAEEFENLGLARANTIKEYLTKRIEMDESQLMISSKEVDRICYVSSTATAHRGASFIFGEKI